MSFILISVFKGRFQVVATESKKLNTTDTIIVSDSIPIESLPCMSSEELRFNSLKSSWKIFLQHPIIGVGTGDWRDELLKEYIDSNLQCNAHEQTAPHNQYLRTLLKYGILGFLIYLYYIFKLFHFSPLPITRPNEAEIDQQSRKNTFRFCDINPRPMNRNTVYFLISIFPIFVAIHNFHS